MVRTPSFDKNGIKKGAWSPEEDSKLEAYIKRFGHWNWRELPKFAGLQRCGKSCRLRWMNYLRADVRRGSYTKEEEDLIMELRQKHGNKWSMIAGRLPGRTDNEIKNHWHTHLKKRRGSSSDKSHVSSSAMDSTASRGGAASLLPPNQMVVDEECFRNIPILESSSVSPARHVLSSAADVSVSSSTSSGGRGRIWEDMIISDCFFSGPEFTSLGDLLEPTTTNYGSSTSMDAELTMEAGLQGDDDFWTMPFSVEDMMSSYDTSNGGRGGIWEDMIMSDCFTSLGDLIDPTTTTTNYGSSTSMDAELTMVAGLQGDDDFWTTPFSVEDMM